MLSVGGKKLRKSPRVAKTNKVGAGCSCVKKQSVVCVMPYVIVPGCCALQACTVS